MENVIITRISIDDLHQLHEISVQTFTETFASFNSAEDMQKFVNTAYSIDKLSREIQDNNVYFYFARLRGEVIGYLKLNTNNSQTEIKDANGIEIERIYVLKEFLGKAVGQILFHHALEIAQKRDCKYIWLGVWEKNTRAIRFYKKNGFIAFDKHMFKLGDDEQTDIMMKLQLF
jgi:diamine N-acetyltransferase